ncbi:AT-rich interactive domain-containing protein 1A [Nematolebias whitei]|uniref:AT-rich interactive domain-containing protein 1A n=1 Tax=Nematolebias whitei TaxID=451745 RepID=UPI00189A73DE|nr:AT-rich interactive domain-containing protein 1A [Nematolebias whitei]
MAAQVASLNTSPPSELKKPDLDIQEGSVPGEKQHENKETGPDAGSPGQKEVQDGSDAAGGGDPDLKNGTGSVPRVNNTNSGTQSDSGGAEGNNLPGMGHQQPGPFAPPPYGYNQHYSRGPFQHGGQQSPGMAAASGPGLMDTYPPNSHEHGYHNNYGPFPSSRTCYQGQGYGPMSSPRSSQPPAAGGQPGKQQPAGGPAAPMAASYNIHRYNVGNQQPTSTPTLNQLLTSPSSVRSYPSYPQGDYNNQEGPGKGPGEVGSGQYGGWQQRTHHPPPMSPGTTGQPPSRTQPPSPMDQVGKIRGQPYGGPNPYSPHQQGPPGGPGPQQGSSYPGQGYGPPGPQRYPMGMQNRTTGAIGSMLYGQQISAYGQQGPGGYNQQNQGYYGQHGPPSHPSQQQPSYPGQTQGSSGTPYPQQGHPSQPSGQHGQPGTPYQQTQVTHGSVPSPSPYSQPPQSQPGQSLYAPPQQQPQQQQQGPGPQGQQGPQGQPGYPQTPGGAQPPQQPTPQQQQQGPLQQQAGGPPSQAQQPPGHVQQSQQSPYSQTPPLQQQQSQQQSPYQRFPPPPQELSQDSFSSQSSAPPSNQPNKAAQEDSMQGRPSSLPVRHLLLSGCLPL